MVVLNTIQNTHPCDFRSAWYVATQNPYDRQFSAISDLL